MDPRQIVSFFKILLVLVLSTEFLKLETVGGLLQWIKAYEMQFIVGLVILLYMPEVISLFLTLIDDAARIKELKIKLRTMLLRNDPTKMLKALNRVNPDILSQDDIAAIQKVINEEGNPEGAACLLQRLSEHRGGFQCLERVFQECATYSKKDLAWMKQMIEELDQLLQKERERHKSKVKKLKKEIDELNASLQKTQDDLDSQSTKLAETEKQLTLRTKELKKQRLQSRRDTQNYKKMLLEVMKNTLEKEQKALVDADDQQKNIIKAIIGNNKERCIRHIFEEWIDPIAVLGLLSKYDPCIITKEDRERVEAVTNNHGPTAGARELLNKLPKYKNWYLCLQKVLCDPELKQRHVADEMNKAINKLQNQDRYTECTCGSQTLSSIQTIERMMRNLGQEFFSCPQCGWPVPGKNPTGVTRSNSESKTSYNILLVGSSGDDNSCTGNSILEDTAFRFDSRDRFKISAVWREFKDIRLRIVNSLIVGDAPLNLVTRETLESDMKHLIVHHATGFHVFLLVLDYLEQQFTEAQQESIRLLERMFGDRVVQDNFIIIIAHNNFDLTTKQFNTWLERQNDQLKGIFRKCNNRYLFFRNDQTDSDFKRNQVVKLLESIRELKPELVGYFKNSSSPVQKLGSLLKTWPLQHGAHRL